MRIRIDGLALIAAAMVSLASGPAHAAKPAVPSNPAAHPVPEQPLPYSHKQHVGLGLQCRLCHVNPSPGVAMTFPATATCMGCHAGLPADRPARRTLAQFAESGTPIPWTRVYTVLPGVTWSHARHLDASVPCESCHGEVAKTDAMSMTTAVTTMASCIGCHEARRARIACNVCHAWPTGP